MPFDTPTGFQPDLDIAARQRIAEHARQATQAENELACIHAAIAGLRERAERAENKLDLLRKALEGMMESYDILMDDTPLGSHPVASGVIRGAFIGAIELSRAVLKPHPSDQARP